MKRCSGETTLEITLFNLIKCIGFDASAASIPLRIGNINVSSIMTLTLSDIQQRLDVKFGITSMNIRHIVLVAAGTGYDIFIQSLYDIVSNTLGEGDTGQIINQRTLIRILQQYANQTIQQSKEMIENWQMIVNHNHFFHLLETETVANLSLRIKQSDDQVIFESLSDFLASVHVLVQKTKLVHLRSKFWQSSCYSLSNIDGIELDDFAKNCSSIALTDNLPLYNLHLSHAYIIPRFTIAEARYFTRMSNFTTFNELDLRSIVTLLGEKVQHFLGLEPIILIGHENGLGRLQIARNSFMETIKDIFWQATSSIVRKVYRLTQTEFDKVFLPSLEASINTVATQYMAKYHVLPVISIVQLLSNSLTNDALQNTYTESVLYLSRNFTIEQLSVIYHTPLQNYLNSANLLTLGYELFGLTESDTNIIFNLSENNLVTIKRNDVKSIDIILQAKGETLGSKTYEWLVKNAFVLDRESVLKLSPMQISIISQKPLKSIDEDSLGNIVEYYVEGLTLEGFNALVKEKISARFILSIKRLATYATYLTLNVISTQTAISLPELQRTSCEMIIREIEMGKLLKFVHSF